jgi:hypothetical protein
VTLVAPHGYRQGVSGRLVILPSPLLGAATYEPLATALGRRGVESVVAPLPAGGVTPASVLVGFRSAAAEHRATVLVAHSNAGYYAPAVADDATLPVVYMDAALPDPDVTTTLLAPPSLAPFLDGLPTTDDLLPPWTQWWGDEDVASLFPTQEWFERVDADAPRLAPAYFGTPVPVPAGWTAGPAAYVAFGDTYAAELGLAERLGWVVRRERGHHLTHLVDPDGVAEVVLALTLELGRAG